VTRLTRLPITKKEKHLTNSPLSTITTGIATHIGDRSANADAAAVVSTPLGVGAAVVDGIGSSADVCTAARLAADVAAHVAAHRGAQAGIMAAADTMPDYPRSPNAVGAVVSIEPGGRIEIAHIGDAAIWTWNRDTGLKRWTLDQTAGAHVDHMRNNPGLTEEDRRKLDGIVDILGDYVLNGLVYATVSTIAWTPLRDIQPDIILITSDGVHKVLDYHHIRLQIHEHHQDPQALADAVVAEAVKPADEAAWHEFQTSRLDTTDLVEMAGPLKPGLRDNATAVAFRITPAT
jgi:PPM family protein phosphatase